MAYANVGGRFGCIIPSISYPKCFQKLASLSSIKIVRKGMAQKGKVNLSSTDMLLSRTSNSVRILVPGEYL